MNPSTPLGVYSMLPGGGGNSFSPLKYQQGIKGMELKKTMQHTSGSYTFVYGIFINRAMLLN